MYTSRCSHADVIVQVEIKRTSDKEAQDKVELTPSFQRFTKADWNTPKRFTITAASADVLGSIFSGDEALKETLSITVDSSATKDDGLSIWSASDEKYTHVLGYASCGVPADSITSPAEEKLTAEELKRKRREVSQKCFSDDPKKITGKNDQVPDKNELEFGVDVKKDNTAKVAAQATAVSVGAVVAVIIIIAVVLAIVGALVAMAIRRKRGEEADRKADVKKGADKAEADISFRMNEMENGGMRDLKGTTSRLKGERDRLKEENQKLAADVGEEPMFCADTEDNDALVGQIKGFKTENDRLREMQSTDNNSKRANRRKKKKADGFGQQRESK